MTMDLVEQIAASLATGLPGHLGMRLTGVRADEVTGELTVVEHLCTIGGILHGGAIMALADTLGAVGAFLNLPPGAHTSTVESKTNFLRAAKVGETVVGTSRLLNKGRTLMLWQTEMRDAQQRLIALVSQSQIILVD
jgi:1,4-dihydroxy-2-naphthoyl-CoA hydrolase